MSGLIREQPGKHQSLLENHCPLQTPQSTHHKLLVSSSKGNEPHRRRSSSYLTKPSLIPCSFPTANRSSWQISTQSPEILLLGTEVTTDHFHSSELSHHRLSLTYTALHLPPSLGPNRCSKIRPKTPRIHQRAHKQVKAETTPVISVLFKVHLSSTDIPLFLVRS